MGLVEKLRAIIPRLPDDGSREAAREYEQLAIEVQDMKRLMQDEGFKRILKLQQDTFTSRLRDLVESDPELRALRVFITRTVGMKAAETNIQEVLKRFAEGEE